MSLSDRSFREKIVLVGVTLPPASAEDTDAGLDELAQLVVTGIRDGRFEFRTINATGQAADWQDEWQARGQMPPLLRLKLQFDDERRRWPEFVVPLRLGTGYIGTGIAANQAGDRP